MKSNQKSSRKIGTRIRNSVLAIVLGTVAALSPLTVLPVSAADSTTCPQGASLNIVAHADDDLIFMNPDIQRDITNGVCVRTIVVTAGDAGRGFDYAEEREAGSRAAYATMAGVTDDWMVDEDYVINGHRMFLFTLTEKPTVSISYMRINDGNVDGSGFDSTGHASLKKLWQDDINSISSIDTLEEYQQTYTKDDLVTTLADSIMLYAPNMVRTMDYVEDINHTVDHTDHTAVGYLVQRAERESVNTNHMAAYRGYTSSNYAANVSGSSLDSKWNAFLAYTPHDAYICQTKAACSASGNPYSTWLSRQYTRGARNIAALATVTASSQASGQEATKAVDGYAVGYPTDSTKEWATKGGKANSWINLAWKSQQTIEKVVLYDRPNTNDRILTGTLTFSDGKTVAVGNLYNSGSATVITFPAKTTNSLKLTIKTVSNKTTNVGLAEMEVVTTNIASDAVATASSENTAAGQTAAKATDGYALGYPTDSNKEWATNGGKAGSWIKLQWSAPRWISRVVLYDRPNTSDRITSGTLVFDNDSVTTGSLVNNGTATIITLPEPVLTTSLEFKVTGVSNATSNVGLAEIQVDDGV